MTTPVAKPDLIAAAVDQIYNLPAPSTLYHYTTNAGLFGILEGKSLWASHVRYLNDRTEYKLAFDYAEELLTKDVDITAKYPKVPSLLKQSFSPIRDTDVFVISFSNDGGNRLSQWRGYCQTGWVSLGISSTLIYEIGVPLQSVGLSPYFASCIYGENAIKESLSELLVKFKEILNQSVTVSTIDDGVTLLKNAIVEFAYATAVLASRSKHDGFDEEKEWRLIIRTKKSFSTSALKFHMRNSSFVPHLEVPLTLPSVSPIPGATLLNLESIRIGPCPHPEEAIQAIKMMLKKHNVNCSKVDQSNIPFRSW